MTYRETDAAREVCLHGVTYRETDAAREVCLHGVTYRETDVLGKSVYTV